MSDNVNVVENLSEEDFDREFENMMNTPIEEDEKSESEGDQDGLQNKEEETNTEEEVNNNEESNKEPETETEEYPENDNEKTEEDSLPGKEEMDIDDVKVNADEDSEESKSEPEMGEFDFNTIPRNTIIPKDIAVNGVQVRATMDELEEGFKKGMNYTQKMQEIAPHRRSMGIMKDNDLTEDDLNLLIEVKSGNKEALTKLLKDTKTDPFDLDMESKDEYTPKDYGKDVVDEEVESMKKEILSDTEYSPQVEDAIQKMPEDMYSMISSNAQGLNSLYRDIKSGVYQKVMPEVMKQQALYGSNEPTIATYLKIAKTMVPQQEEKPKAEEKPKVNKTELNNKRKKAASSANVDKKKSPKSFIDEDLDDMSEEDFDKNFEKMMGRSINDYKE